MRLGLIVPVLAMSLALGVADAGAQQWITNATCDSVLIDGVLHPRVSFEIQDVRPGLGVECVVAFRLAPTGPEDPCGVVSAAGPEKWLAQADTMTTGEVVVFWAPTADGAPRLLPLGGFQLVLTPGHSCCFEFSLTAVIPEPFAYETVCFECDRVVPVIGRTWGAVKALYR